MSNHSAAQDSGRPFLELLLEIYELQESGVVEVRAENVTTIVYFRRGQPVSVEGGVLGQTIGRVLLSQGVLDDDQYAKIITAMTDKLFDDEHMRFGEVAVKLGFLQVDQVHSALAEQVRQRVMHCMQWDEPNCTFRSGEEKLEGRTPFPCGVEALVLDGLKRYYDQERLQPLIEGMADQYPWMLAERADIGRWFALEDDEKRFVNALSSEMTLAQTLLMSKLDEEHGNKLVLALFATGMLYLSDDAGKEETEPTLDEARVAGPAARPAKQAPPERAAAPYSDVRADATRQAREAEAALRKEAAQQKLAAELAQRKAQEEQKLAAELAERKAEAEKKLAQELANKRVEAERKLEQEIAVRRASQPRVEATREQASAPAADELNLFEALEQRSAADQAALDDVLSALPAGDDDLDDSLPAAKHDLESTHLPAARQASPRRPDPRRRQSASRPDVIQVPAAGMGSVRKRVRNSIRSPRIEPTRTRRDPRRPLRDPQVARALKPQPAPRIEQSAAAPPSPADDPLDDLEMPSLPPNEGPAPAEVRRARLKAEAAFRDGRRALRQGSFSGAATAFRRAQLMHPEAIEYELHAEWAELQLNADEREEREERLAKLVLEALKHDKRLGFAYYVQGQLLLRRQDYRPAAKAFARAYQLDKTDHDAKRHYVIAKRRAEE